MTKKQIVKAMKDGKNWIVQFKSNFDSKRNNYILESGLPMKFSSEEDALNYAKANLPAWMFPL